MLLLHIQPIVMLCPMQKSSVPGKVFKLYYFCLICQVSTANEAGNVGDITTSMSVGVTVGAVSADTSSTNKNSALSAASTISGKSQPPSSLANKSTLNAHTTRIKDSKCYVSNNKGFYSCDMHLNARTKTEMSGHTALRRDETVVETYRRM